MAGEVTKAKLDELEIGLNAALDQIQQILLNKAYAETLPIIGNALSTSSEVTAFVDNVREKLRGAIDAVSNQNLAILNTGQVQAALQQSINDALATLGAGSGGVTLVASSPGGAITDTSPPTSTVAVDTQGNITITVDADRLIRMPFNLNQLGMSGLNLNMQGQGNADLSYNFDFQIGHDTQGFWLNPAMTNAMVSAKVSLNNLGISGQAGTGMMGPLFYSITNIDDNGTNTALPDTLDLVLTSVWNGNPGTRLRPGSFNSTMLDVRATSVVDLDLALATNMGTAALPSISTALHADWSFSNQLLNGTAANSWGNLQLSFTDVTYDFGTFIENYVKPITYHLANVLGPINQALAIFRTDIGGLLPPAFRNILDVVDDDKITLLDFLQISINKFGGSTTDLTRLGKFADTVANIVDWAGFFSGHHFSSAAYKLGDWSYLYNNAQGDPNALAGVNVAAGFTQDTPDLKQFLNNLRDLGESGFAAAYNGTERKGADLAFELLTNPQLSFPILSNPQSIVRLMVGQDVDLFKLDLPTIALNLGMDANGAPEDPLTAFGLTIWPLPPVEIKLGIAAQVLLDLMIGYDSKGVRQYAQALLANPGNPGAANTAANQALLFNGFYLDDQRTGANDIAEVTIRAAIDLVVEGNLALVSIGGGGFLGGELRADLANGVVGADGKMYFTELQQFLSANPITNLFDLSGDLSAGLRAYVNSPFGKLWDWDESVVFANFGGQGATPGPPAILAGVTPFSDLLLYAGGDAQYRNVSATVTKETFKVTNDGTNYVVSAFGRIHKLNNGATSITVDAGQGDDTIELDDTVDLPADLKGGPGLDRLRGGDVNDTIDGGTADDFLRGGNGNDQLIGGDGNDQLEGDAGADMLDGGTGDHDYATYRHSAAGITLDFTSGNHSGDAQGDLFVNVEVFEGSKHNDIMIGDAAADRFSGIEGSDTLLGMGGNDQLAGGLGNNTLDGGDGIDAALYNVMSGSITVVMNDAGGGTVTGDGFQDTLIAIEEVDGTVLADTMTGGAGNEIFVGLDGNDTLRGGGGDDVLVGGPGADTMRGGAGIDRVSYHTSQAGVVLWLESPTGTGGDAQGDTFRDVGGAHEIENLTGSEFGDTLGGNPLNNMIFGRQGNDTLNGVDGDDILEGGPGGDTLNGGAGYDFASYANADMEVRIDRITGIGYADSREDTYISIEGYIGSKYDDIIRGTNDPTSSTTPLTITQTTDNENNAGTGAADNDVGVQSNWTAANPVEFNIVTPTMFAPLAATLTINAIDVDPANGTDPAELDEVLLNGISIGFLTLGAHGNQATSVSTFQINPALLIAGANRITVRNVNTATPGEWFFNVTGATLTATVPSQLEEIRGGGGADTLFGGGGMDRLLGEDGNDTIDGEADDDIILGGIGSDTLKGGGGNDQVGGGDDVDTLDGDDGADTLDGGAAGDTLRGGIGNDVLIGGAGDDTIDGGADRDLVDYQASTAGVVVNLSGAQLTPPGGAVINPQSARDGFGGTDSISNVEDARGSAFNDVMYALGTGSVFEGLAGDDRLNGRAGDDILRGGAGLDALYGGNGRDVLNGGQGGDYLNGEDGDEDMASWEDDGAAVTASLMTNTAIDGSGALDTLAGIEWLRGSAFDDTLSGSAGVNRIEGGAGIDTIDGKGGADTLVGGAGDDIYYVDNATGIVTDASDDTVIDASGSDIVKSRVNYTLGSDVEDLQLLGVATTGTGNASANRLIGNGQANILDGGASGDTFWGYAGDDTYRFDDLGDSVGTGDAPRGTITGAGEVVNGGTDTIELATANIVGANNAVITYRLDQAWATQVENLKLVDNVRRVDLVGNALGNHLTGNNKDQILDGLGGDDRLDVGVGRDTASGGAGLDTLVVDWSSVTNNHMDVFTLSGSLAAGYSGAWYTNNYDSWFRVDFSGIERFELKGGTLNDRMLAGDGNDIVGGGDGNDYLETSAGFDVIDGGAGDNDRWWAIKSAATIGMTINLATASTYVMPTGTGSVVNVEALGFDGNRAFQSGEGNDVFTTLALDRADYIQTNGGADRVTLYAGRDVVHMGTQAAGTQDTLVVDWSAKDGVNFDVFNLTGTLADGYAGQWYTDNYDSSYRVDFTGVERFEIRGGKVVDVIRTGDADDIVFGNEGNDQIYSRKGADQINGGAGVDLWNADKGDAAIDQPIVLDLTLTGVQSTYMGIGTVEGIERIELTTGAGNDVITTHDSDLADVVVTGLGDDTVKFWAGRDTATMGGGFDTLIVDWSTKMGVHFDVFTLTGSLAAGYSGVWYTNNYDSSYRVDYSGVERFRLSSGNGNDRLLAGDGDDTVASGAGNDYLETNAGADVIDGGAGDDDRWWGIKSAATVGMTINLAQASTYVVPTGTGSVVNIEALGFDSNRAFQSGEGNDVFTTLALDRADYIQTNGGADRVTLYAGRDVVHMGTQAAGTQDTLVVDWSAKDGVNFDVFNLTGTLADGYAGQWYTNNYDSSHRVDFTGVERFELKGGKSVDVIATGDADDIVFGNDGNDQIYSRKGADQINGGTGVDLWNADKSDATSAQPIVLDLTLTGVQSTYMGIGTVEGIERVQLSTGAGADVITTHTSALDDLLVTAGGNDTVKFWAGRDTATMGEGFDTLIVDWSLVTNNHMDVFTFSGSFAAGYSGAWYTNNYDSWYRVDFSGVERFELKAGLHNDLMNTGDGDDVVFGNGGNDSIYSRKGVDRIDGGEGVDLWNADKSDATAAQPIVLDLTLTGVQSTYMGTGTVAGIERIQLTTGAGNDVITTHSFAQDDVVVTGAGDDVVKVTAGRDVITMGTGSDTLIVDWSGVTNNHMDVFNINGSLAAGYSGSWYTNNYDSGYRIDFSGVERFQLTGGIHNDVIRGGDGNDTLSGNAGNDGLYAGSGNDMLDGGAGNDTLDGGGGDDTYVVDTAEDLVIEAANGGNDTVRTNLASYSLANLPNVENLVGTRGAGGQTLTGNAGANVITGSIGNDLIDGGAGTDVAVYSGARAGYELTRLADGRVKVVGADGTDTLSGIEQIRFSDMTVAVPGTLLQQTVVKAYNGFGAQLSFGGWTNNTLFPRQVADVNGDGRADIVGFGDEAVYVALGQPGGGFGGTITATAQFGRQPHAGNWASQELTPRSLGDVNGDGRADIIGFGRDGIHIAYGQANGTFGAAFKGSGSFGANPEAGSWTGQDKYPRAVGDVNGDGRADVIGFGDEGVFVALGNGDGSFGNARLALNVFGASNVGGNWVGSDVFPRMLSDVNGDGRSDVVGFGAAGVYVAYGRADGTLSDVVQVSNSFGANVDAGGWSSNFQFPRMAVDVNGDKIGDLVGFGGAGVFIQLGTPGGGFAAPVLAINGYGRDPSAGEWLNTIVYPRFFADVNADGLSDIIGFGDEGVFITPAASFLPIG